jgi:DNA-binding response OmpR family regulator
MDVLVVEDDDAIASSLSAALTLEGFAVSRVSTGRAALDRDGAELVLLDLGLPDLDGLEVCRQLRQRSSAAIIVLTARGEEIDRVLGLEVGADDYVVKPFSMRELIARVRAVGRRVTKGSTDEPDRAQLIGPLEIDRRGRRVRVDGDAVDLTAKEFDLLAYLAEAPGTVHSRQELLTELWDAHWYGPTKTVDVHVASIRRKLGHPGWIEAVRGVGFRLEQPAPGPTEPIRGGV